MAQSAKEIVDYLMNTYFDQLVPIIMSEDVVIYYDVTIE